MDTPLHCLGSGLYRFPRRSFPVQRPEILEKISLRGGLPDRTVEIPQVQVEGRLIEEHNRETVDGKEFDLKDSPRKNNLWLKPLLLVVNAMKEKDDKSVPPTKGDGRKK
jgi:hypothetical protein